MGCLICQRYCPENKSIVNWSERREHFSARETRLILDGSPLDEVPEPASRKLEHIGMIDDYTLLARNLRLVLESDDLYSVAG